MLLHRSFSYTYVACFKTIFARSNILIQICFKTDYDIQAIDRKYALYVSKSI